MWSSSARSVIYPDFTVNTGLTTAVSIYKIGAEVVMRYLLLLAPLALWAGPARYARLGEMAGTVEVQIAASETWIAAERNAPLPEAARIRTSAASRVEIELDEGGALRLGPDSQAELSDYARLSTGQRVTLLSIERGVVYCTGAPEGRDALTLAIPGAQLTFTRLARVRVEVEEVWSQIAVLEGAARFSSPAADLELRAGQATRVEPANPARFFFQKEASPAELDQWSAERDEALKSPSAAHTVQRYGLADLDGTGEWILTQELGAVWRPKVDEDWRPYRDGKWRWYDGLGYVWIAGERWGWLPYHYGRWARPENLGWVWTPSKNGVFKPGEVYWVRGEKFAGWGPLAPGEQWDPANDSTVTPQQFLHANTTYAAFRPGAVTIDPAGFKGLPKDPLKEGAFLGALPSPPFPASKLDATRPIVNAASLRVKPVVEDVRIEAQPVPRRSPAPAPAAAPVVIITQAAPPTPPVTEVVEVPVAVPAGIVFLTPPRESRPVPVPVSLPAAPARRVRRYRGQAESRLVSGIVQKLERRIFDKALADLDEWTTQFAESDFAAERTYYYMLAWNGLEKASKVVDVSAAILTRPVREVFEEPMQALSAVYVTTANYLQVGRPTRQQAATARSAAREMLGLLPDCFTAQARPPAVSEGDWAKSRTLLETMARDTLARATR